MGWPAWRATRIFAIPPSLVAMSNTTGGCAFAGMAMASGLVPTSGSAPPGAGMTAREFDMAMPMQPSAAAIPA